jgi:4-diphosphocytidyl-2-C-methyl-D-erythritol kinase
MIRELAPAKVNLVLHVGPRRADGLHEVCSLLGSLELADLVEVDRRTDGAALADRVECPGVPEPNLAAKALAAYRASAGPTSLPALDVRIDKRIPIAAGLGGGSADAAGVLRAADTMSERPIGAERLRRVASGVGADVPSQVEPGHALVTGAGERVEPVELPPVPLVLVPQDEGLATGSVYGEADRLGTTRTRLESERLRALARAASIARLADALENDLEPAALSLRPELAGVADRLRGAGARGTLVSGSGPTLLGVFDDHLSAERAASEIGAGAIATRLRGVAPEGAATGQDRERTVASRQPRVPAVGER